MSVTGEPEREEVLGWIRRTGGTAADAVEHFFPGISPEAKVRMGARYRKWIERSKAAPAPNAAPSPQGAQHRSQSPVGVDMPDPPPNLAELDDEAYRVWQLEYLGSCLRVFKRSPREALAVLEQMGRARLELEAWRARRGSTLKLEPTPQAVALRLEKEDKTIRLLVEAAEALERAAKQQAKEDL